MHVCPNPLCCYVPPYIADRLAESDDPELRSLAIEAIKQAAAARTLRQALSKMPLMAAIPSTRGTKQRLIYNMEGLGLMQRLPGELVRAEGDPETGNEAVDEAYDYSGITYDFYAEQFNRNSLDDRGMALISSINFGKGYNNASWNGEQMAYGNGDGIRLTRFTKSLDVVAHELTHGLIQFESNLEYEYESGALNEHFADVMGAMVKQWHLKQDVTQADWLMGTELIGPGITAKALRTFTTEKAYQNDPLLGTDPQPKHIKDRDLSSRDNGGVHINSGIPNHAFYRTALAIGGNAWEKAGRIWYITLRQLSRTSQFQEAADVTYQIAESEYGTGSLEQQAVKTGWDAVGITV